MSVSFSSQRWQQVQDLFDEVVDLSAEARAARLDEACQDDPEVRREVDSLLAAYDQADERLRDVDQLVPAPLPAVAPSRTGTRVAHYHILEKLGGGGMGVVYKARDTRLDRSVALKFLPPHLSANEEAKVRLIHEAKAASALDHPNIAVVHEIGETQEGQLFIVMAYYAGGTLKKKITQGRLPIDDAVALATQVAQGLSKAHAAGIVHRDIKPANVIVTEEAVAKIVDFGLAKVASRTQLTKTGTTMGTVSYMSPEQARGEAVDHRTDLWALGVVLYEMLTGERPFKGDYDQAVIYSLLHTDPKPITVLRTDIPPELEDIVDQALAKDLDERYQHVDEMLADLRAFTELSASEKAPTGPRNGRLPKKKGSRTIALIGLGLVIALSVFFAIATYFGPKQNTSTSDNVTTGSTNRVAVFPFSVGGAPEYSYLSEGMADLLSTNLDGAGALNSINQHALLKVISEDPERQLDTDYSRMIAKRFDAGLFVLGNIVEAGGRLRIRASLYEAIEGSEPVATATAEGKAEDLFEMTDNLTAQLIAAISQHPAERLTRLATRTTNSIVALKAYLEGEIYRREGRILDAVSAYQRAVSEDTTFALAYYRMAERAVYSGLDINLQETLESAVRHAAQLSERNRLLIDAFYHTWQTHSFKAEELYRNIVSLYPDEIEAWVALGTIQWYNAGRLGRSLDDARKSLERAVYYDPDNLPAVPFLWLISIWEGKQARSDSLGERLQTLVPASEKTIQTRAWLAFSKGDAAAQERIIEQARAANSFEIRLTSTSLSRISKIHTSAQQFSNTERFARLLTEPTRSADDHFWGYRILTNLQLTRGFWRAAREELREAESVKPIDALQYRAFVYLTPLLPVTETELQDLRREIVNLNDDSVQAPVYRNYFAGLLSARLGDNSLAQSYADTLEVHANRLMTQEQHKRVSAMAVDYALSVRAHVAWNERDFQKALNLLDESHPEKWRRMTLWYTFEVQPYERYMRAELLKSLKRYEEALRWYSTLGYGGFPEFVYSPISHFKQGEVYEALGQPEKAAEQYATFIAMWKDCDPALRPVVATAERSLERLLQEKAKES